MPLCLTATARHNIGEVGLDADNAETQEIVDGEVIEAEEAAGVFDKSAKAAKKAKKRDKYSGILGHDAVGKNEWVEEKGWWKEHAKDMDTSNMTKRQKKDYDKVRKMMA